MTAETVSTETQPEIWHSFEEFETSLRRERPMVWWATLCGPFVITAAVLSAIGIVAGMAMVGRTVFAAAATFFIFGRFAILLGSDASAAADAAANVEAAEYVRFLTSEELFALVTYMDFMTALLIAFHIGFLFRLPWAGPKLAGVAADAHFILRMMPWMRRATFLGLVVFVVFPTSTTGSIGGSIVGRLLGMGRFQTLMAIFTGSVIGNGIMYYFSEQLHPWKEMFQDSLAAQIATVIVIIVLVVAIEKWFRYKKKQFLANLEES